MNDIINNPEKAKEMSERNYKLGKKLFSYDILEQKLTELLPKKENSNSNMASAFIKQQKTR